MFSVKRTAERERIRKQEEETTRVAHTLGIQRAIIKSGLDGCTDVTLLLSFGDKHSGPVFFGDLDIDKALYALNALKRQGKTIKDHFAEEYAKADKVDAAPVLPKAIDWSPWVRGTAPATQPADVRPIKPEVSRTTSKRMGRLAKVSIVRDRLEGFWSDGTPSRRLSGFPIDATTFNGHPVKTGAVVEDYTVAGARFVIDANNHRWELIS